MTAANCGDDGLSRHFEGPDLALDVWGSEELLTGELHWEGTLREPDGHCHHRALAEAGSPEEAIDRVGAAAARSGSFTGFDATVVRKVSGEPWDGTYCRSTAEIDWGTPELASISGLQRAILLELMDGRETALLIAEADDVDADEAGVTSALDELECQHMVEHRLGPAPEGKRVPWWGITDAGWERLQMIRRPTY
ncbi:MAG TPA: hypothetical protein VHT27_05800 [Solirubrobacteraceae bacterium]|jgi:hypothetical protein|nr:hypothetical protein [Solirubrobacteraceae bacterium]